MQVTQLTAGSTFNPAPTEVVGFSSADGWVLKYRLVPSAVGGTPILLTCVAATGGLHQPSANAAATATWAPGEYTWHSWVERAGEIYDVEQNRPLTILPNPRTAAAGTDGRSQAARAVADLKAALAAHGAQQGLVAEYEIAGRRMKFKTTAEIIQQIEFWEGRVAREEESARLAAGGRPRNRILTRFTRPT